MKKETQRISGMDIPVYSLDTVVIGSGCAGLNAADWLHTYGRRSITLITEGIGRGTSRNAGSDKQTYYKLSLASGETDSVRELALDLFNGGGVNGDTALAEASCSVKSFIKLSLLGVPFPENEYGEYVGYKTDHDPKQRATSAGPLTSRYMTEALEKSVRSKNIKIFDSMQVAKLLIVENRIIGLVAFDLSRINNKDFGLTVFIANSVILATGGPASAYASSVYPASQFGASGLAISEGVRCCNLNEWQYGMASTLFRWNLSGNYQQALPRYIAVDKNGHEREFLRDYFRDDARLLEMVFLKGYQWPFDSAKINGSSIIDLLVHSEIADKGNRVFLDFTRDPTGLDSGLSGCDPAIWSKESVALLAEAPLAYLRGLDALLQTPVRRLEKMNPQAIGIFKAHGIDLYTEPLEISICAQHCNGGIDVDSDWQSSVRGLYAAGEAAGTFGIYRPGGSALNSAQVGGMRAAEHIAVTSRESIPAIDPALVSCIGPLNAFCSEVLRLYPESKEGSCADCADLLTGSQKLMTKYAAHLRFKSEIQGVGDQIADNKAELERDFRAATVMDIPRYFAVKSALVTQLAVLSAIDKAMATSGSRGSGLVIDIDGKLISSLIPQYCFMEEDLATRDLQFVTVYSGTRFTTGLRKVRAIPEPDTRFENVWSTYRDKMKIRQ